MAVKNFTRSPSMAVDFLAPYGVPSLGRNTRTPARIRKRSLFDQDLHWHSTVHSLRRISPFRSLVPHGGHDANDDQAVGPDNDPFSDDPFGEIRVGEVFVSPEMSAAEMAAAAEDAGAVGPPPFDDFESATEGRNYDTATEGSEYDTATEGGNVSDQNEEYVPPYLARLIDEGETTRRRDGLLDSERLYPRPEDALLPWTALTSEFGPEYRRLYPALDPIFP